MRRNPSVYRAREQGNVLMLTLLAVLLFGALCYAVIRPTSEVTLDQEKDLVSAAQVMQYPAMLRTTVSRMMTQGLPVDGLSFAADDATTGGVFSTTGGMALRQAPPEGIGNVSQWRFKTAPANGTGWFVLSDNKPGRNAKDVFAFLDDLSLPVCQQILRALGLPHQPLVENTSIDFTGDNEGTINQTGGAEAADTARTASDKYVFNAWFYAKKPQDFACVQNGENGRYVYYHILVDR